MDDDQQFCLRWNNHQSTLVSVFDTLLESGTLVDCTLAAEGKFLKAHKVVLSACSPYFASLLSQQYDKHPIFILKDVKFQELRAMMDYMYRGEVNISQDQLSALLKAAESLQIKGLSDSRGGSSTQKPQTNEQKQQLVVPTTATGVKLPLSSGYTVESKRIRHAVGAGLSTDSQDLSGSREGSSSPTSRKRKIIRRRSVENIVAETQEHSNSSSHSMQVNSSAPTVTSATIASVSTCVSTPSLSTPSTAATVTGNIVASATAAIIGTKKTESILNAKLENLERDMGNDNDDNLDENEKLSKKEQSHKQRKIQQSGEPADSGNDNSEMLIEPKNEYDDGNDETVEDLTLDDEELEDLEQAGPSHGAGEGSSQGYAQWQVDRSQDEMFMATQETAAQQRDPQDLRKNKSDTTSKKVLSSTSTTATETSSVLITTNVHGSSTSLNSLLATDVSDMLYEFYKANSIQIPKDNKYDNFPRRLSTSSLIPIGPDLPSVPPSTSSLNAPSTKTENYTKLSTNNPVTSSTPSLSSIASLSVVSSFPKNVNGDEMVLKDVISVTSAVTKRSHAPFHPRIKYSNINNKLYSAPITSNTITVSTAASKSVSPVAVPLPAVVPSVIQAPVLPHPPAAAAIAAAFFRDGYHNFHQQIRAQELLKQQQQQQQEQQQQIRQEQIQQSSHHKSLIPQLIPKSQKYMKNLIKNKDNRSSENDESSSLDQNDQDDEYQDDEKYPEIDDIHLIEGSKSNFTNQISSVETDYMSDESHKYSAMAAQALRNLEYSFIDYSGAGAGEEPLYQCRHCGKKYRWKSTLRRHENVECGGKEPSHQCPYCPYKSKQRGNLGVHVRKHHANLPQLASKRRSKFSQPQN